MNTFLLVAALMAAIAAAAVAFPLLRDRQSRVVGGVAAVLILGASAGLYGLWSTWDWHAPPPAPRVGSAEILAMVAKLEQRMKEHPDATGWSMLGRSYLALERFDDAVAAYQHAHLLDASNADATLGLGEALSLRAGGDITPEAGELFEQALSLAPDNPKALLYGGFAALERNDKATAKARFLALRNMNPPAQIMSMLDARIAELDGAAGGAASAGLAGGAAGVAAEDPAAQAVVQIRLAPALKSKLTGEAPLFIFAREPGGRGPPLAAKRLTSAAIGSEVRLSSADSMVPGRAIRAGQRVSITARVSFSGQPLPAAGDLYGEISYDVGNDAKRELIIDRVAE